MVNKIIDPHILVAEAQKRRQSDLDALVSEVEKFEGTFVGALLALKPAATRLNELNKALQLAELDETIDAGHSGWAHTHHAPKIAGLGAQALMLVQAAEDVKNE
jgi:hypothetical protein